MYPAALLGRTDIAHVDVVIITLTGAVHICTTSLTMDYLTVPNVYPGAPRDLTALRRA